MNALTADGLRINVPTLNVSTGVKSSTASPIIKMPLRPTGVDDAEAEY
ncbi:MAG: hypothetical protein WCD86_15250 [Ktedonobacteraceae bacterium]